MTHALKTWPEFYKAIESGEKTFELRRNDSPFKVGDILLLQEYDPKKREYTGNETKRTITYILQGDVNKFGLFADFCVMSIKDCFPDY
jgi:glyoxylate utilization-related uncharacterized protein